MEAGSPAAQVRSFMLLHLDTLGAASVHAYLWLNQLYFLFVEMHLFKIEKSAKCCLRKTATAVSSPRLTRSETCNPWDAPHLVFGAPDPFLKSIFILSEISFSFSDRKSPEVFQHWHFHLTNYTAYYGCSFWAIIILIIGASGYFNRKSGSFKASAPESMQREPSWILGHGSSLGKQKKQGKSCQSLAPIRQAFAIETLTPRRGL